MSDKLIYELKSLKDGNVVISFREKSKDMIIRRMTREEYERAVKMYENPKSSDNYYVIKLKKSML